MRPISDINSQASCWLRTTSPRRIPPGRLRGAYKRSKRMRFPSKSLRWLPAFTKATSIGTSCSWRDGAKTLRCHASPESGGSSCTINGRYVRDVTGAAHFSKALERSVAKPGVNSKGSPSKLAKNTSLASTIVCAFSGAAGLSMRLLACRQIVSATSVRIDRVIVCPSIDGDKTDTEPGMASPNALIRS